LKAVAVSDCLNGVGLLIVGLWVPAAALRTIGGLSGLFAEPDFIKPMVSESEVFDDATGVRSLGEPSMPWHVTISGLMLQNLYYWSTNQLIVQRALAARSLAEGQKGVLFAASMKVVGFTVLCLPGVIGALMVKNGVSIDGKPFVVEKSDTVYPLLVKAVMPEWSLGFFAAVLLGSILSTFNSALQSASTLFGLEIYKIYINPEASDSRVVKVASMFAIVISLASFVIAPLLSGVTSIFDWLQHAKAMASLPIISTFLVGIATVTPDAFAAKVGFVVGVVMYGAGQALKEPHFLHVFMICFCASLASTLAATYVQPLRRLFRQPPAVPFHETVAAVVDIKSWPGLYPVIGAVFLLVGLLTVSLQVASQPLFLVFFALWLLAVGALVLLPSWRPPLPRQEAEAKDAAKVEVEEPNASFDGEAESNRGATTV
jgi:SSS family solute:Na+ symporter